jgi:hypothetical protein
MALNTIQQADLYVPRVRLFLLFEAAVFAVAALVHAGVLATGYEHREARIAESLLAVVLFMGFLLSMLRPTRTRVAGIASQGIALMGTLVGIFTIIVGVGPRTIPDIVYHLAIIAVLSWGLLQTIRAPSNPSEAAWSWARRAT